MSLTITKSGIADSFQDLGRLGYQHLGINPDGAMDAHAAQLANALLGNECTLPVLEMTYPAARIRFNKPALICITGADFSPALNHTQLPLNHPVLVNAGTELSFQKPVSGMWTYLALKPSFRLQPWLGSASTNSKAGVGGYHGRRLQTGDEIPLIDGPPLTPLPEGTPFRVLPWSAPPPVAVNTSIAALKGPEWHALTSDAKQLFEQSAFFIGPQADRMGYRLKGPALSLTQPLQMLSSGVATGTLQLLPDGQLIALMAGRQTTGGYPQVAHVITAHLPLLAQKRPNDALRFELTDLESATEKWRRQQKQTQLLQNACKFRLEKWLHDTL
jgi:antagonist of KipI